ncbi:TPA: DUF3108 domain-containing protein [Candidatus Poribacteria bacterium]|nr:DUF3108 domain-containing protein [Candidatus Poribacteria bacterium]
MKLSGYKFGFSFAVSFCLTVNVLTFAIYPLLAQNNIEPNPIRVGEVLTFGVKVRGIPAGSQMMKVAEKTTLNGQSVYHLTSAARTNRIFSLFYKFEDARESYVTTEQFQPLRYVKNIVDRKYKANIHIDFDIDSGKVKLSKNQKQLPELEVPMGIQDELSMLYLFRKKELKVGETYTFPALIGTKVVEIRVEIVKREKSDTVLGKLDTIALRSSHGYMVWITDDERRIPVRIEANTKVGKLVGTLKRVDYI